MDAVEVGIALTVLVCATMLFCTYQIEMAIRSLGGSK